MDALGKRSQLMAVLDRAMERAQKAQRDAESGQHGLFGVFHNEDHAAQNDSLPNVPDWDEYQRLQAEKEILGFFITGHPLQKYQYKLFDLSAIDTEAICAMKQGTGKDEISTAGILGNIRPVKSRKGEMYAQGTMEDMAGEEGKIMFSHTY